jgi:hypothetical protein
MFGINVEEDDELEAAEPTGYQPIMLESREEEEQLLGPPGDRSECFGCVYVGERTNVPIPYEPVAELFEMQRKSLGKVKMAVLAKAMAKKHAEIRREVNRVLAERGDQHERMAEWRARDILEHIRNHNQDPQVQQIIMLEEVQELRERALNASLERDAETGHVRCNKDQLACYEKMAKLQTFLQGVDPSKQAMYAPNARVDAEAKPMSGRNLISYWKRQKRN